MQINKKDLNNKLITKFSYHDAIILKVTKNNNDITILLKDGWIDEQVNEIKFINSEIKHQFELEDREIYQLDDLVYFDKWFMSFLVWANNGLLEKIEFSANNIISKKYETNTNKSSNNESLIYNNLSLVEEENLNESLLNK